MRPHIRPIGGMAFLLLSTFFWAAEGRGDPPTAPPAAEVTYTPLARPGAAASVTVSQPPLDAASRIPSSVAPASPPPVTTVVDAQHAGAEVAPSSRRKKHYYLGLSADVGLPDGALLGLAILPNHWLRLSLAGGTNSAAWGGRLGLTFLPLGFGPSLSFEAGRYGATKTNAMMRSFFNVPSWVDPYVQEIGYSYLNSQLGFDLRLGQFLLYLHGGYSYIAGVIRAPQPVNVTGTSGAVLYQVHLVEEGRVSVHTWSLKAALVFLFAGI